MVCVVGLGDGCTWAPAGFGGFWFLGASGFWGLLAHGIVVYAQIKPAPGTPQFPAAGDWALNNKCATKVINV
jgi:hypothetical protein